jgi:hypothetical protein
LGIGNGIGIGVSVGIFMEFLGIGTGIGIRKQRAKVLESVLEFIRWTGIGIGIR